MFLLFTFVSFKWIIESLKLSVYSILNMWAAKYKKMNNSNGIENQCKILIGLHKRLNGS